MGVSGERRVIVAEIITGESDSVDSAREGTGAVDTVLVLAVDLGVVSGCGAKLGCDL